MVYNFSELMQHLISSHISSACQAKKAEWKKTEAERKKTNAERNKTEADREETEETKMKDDTSTNCRPYHRQCSVHPSLNCPLHRSTH
mmetsp:Transcript_88325/g.142926  ORF Transcript_88325/g.142926 Transcript_88325/m.142926 type:complete len:88 (+) Transcript_88325:41-304(+)